MLLNAMNNKWPGTMQCIVLDCLLFVAALRCEAQANLIPNPSFEDADTCAVQLGFFPNGIPQYWMPVSDTPDHFRSCVSLGSPNGIPVNTVGYQFPQDGESYAGFFAYLVMDYREMIGAELVDPLTIGQTYYGSFWANAAYGGPQQTGSACNNIGMLFTMQADHWQQGMPEFALRNYAHVYSPDVINDTAGWTLVSGSFVADSAYQYVVIGNHFNNVNTTVQVIGPGNPNKAYVFVDGFCLSTDPTGCPLWESVQTHDSDDMAWWISSADGVVRVEWDQLPVANVAVLDALGRRLVSEPVGNRSSAVMDAHHWPSGYYVVRLEGPGLRQAKKFVVMQ